MKMVLPYLSDLIAHYLVSRLQSYFSPLKFKKTRKFDSLKFDEKKTR